MYYNDEEDDYREYEEREKREMRTLPDFYIEPTAKCGVCKKQNNSSHPLDWVCSECGEPTHTECGRDCEPSGGWDRDYEVNYWVCANCSKSEEADEQTVQTVPVPDREKLGELVRQVWVEKAKELPDPKASHLLPWADLDEWNKEVDRCIGERVAQYVINQQKEPFEAFPITDGLPFA